MKNLNTKLFLNRVYLHKLTFFLLALIIMTASICIVKTTEAEEIAHSKYYSTEQITLPDGKILEKSIINGPPTPPPGIERATLSSLPEPNKAAGLNTISDVPAFTWCFGCSATSAAMIAGYYDRHGYSNMYTGPANNGKMPLNNNTYWTTWVDSYGGTRNRCPLSATQNGVDGRVTRGHVDDYWLGIDNAGPDPFVTNGWTEHTLGECTADYMGTNQAPDPMNNVDGSTTFFYWTEGSSADGDKITAAQIFSFGATYYNSSGMYGIKEFYESRGYTVVEAYNQKIYPYLAHTTGFTYAQYKAEIDAGRPVLINVTGHTMIGIGYDDSSSNLMYIHDTWDHLTHTMIWGGDYSGMTHYAVTIVVLEESNENGAMPWMNLLLLN
ncbi:MAG: C39 family peptidase [Desulfobacteraceae bacterium]|nr:C39 family peptidase [Desulfobacteraceae bacterium]